MCSGGFYTLKTLSQVDRMLKKSAVTPCAPIRVCMHVRGVVRTDGRVMREATALVEAGFTVTILDFEDDLTRPVEEDIGGIHVKHIMKPNWLIPTNLKSWRLVKSTKKLIYTAMRVIQMPADIYHAHDSNALAACYVAATWHRKPLVFDAHELPLNEPDGTSRWLPALVTRLLAVMLRRCTGIITVSSPIAQEICKRYHVPQVCLVRNILPYQMTATSDRLQKYLGLSSSVRIALYQGNLDSRGLERLIPVASYLVPHIVIGMMGRAEATIQSNLEKLVIQEGVSNQVRIIPPVPYAELLTWTASADICLVVYSPTRGPRFAPNIQMCLPNKLFEYLMAGLPVLSSSLYAVSEVIQTYDVSVILAYPYLSQFRKVTNLMLPLVL